MSAAATTATPTPTVHAALLGVDWALDPASGRYRFATIYPGDNTREDYRSPLGRAGPEREGRRLCAGGQRRRTARADADPDSLLQTADADTTVDLTIADSPGGQRRHAVVKPVAAELGLREAGVDRPQPRRWSTACPAARSAMSTCRTWSSSALQQFVRQFYAQLDKQALIVDDRWNGGGFIAPFALERLRRTAGELGRQPRAADRRPSRTRC